MRTYVCIICMYVCMHACMHVMYACVMYMGVSTCVHSPHVTCLGSLFAQALKAQMDQLHKRVMKDCVTKPALDGQINDVAKRLADVEW